MLKILSVICGMMSAAALASGEIQSPDSPRVSHDKQVEILSFASEWPDGRAAARVHYAERTPQLQAWCYEHGLSAYQIKRAEERYVALGGSPAARVSSRADADGLINTLRRAIGYR